MIRFFDILFSLLGLLILLPFFILIAFIIVCTTKSCSVFYIQQRVGKNNKDFTLIKFRTMRKNADKTSLLTVGENDVRITKTGRFLRKYKLDELPQLWNVLKGDMSLVGPRPEVRKYVNLYTDDQKLVLKVRPGITDYASIEYVNENQLLARSKDPEKYYMEEIMPKKLLINLTYIENCKLKEYFKILLVTVRAVFR